MGNARIGIFMIFRLHYSHFKTMSFLIESNQQHKQGYPTFSNICVAESVCELFIEFEQQTLDYEQRRIVKISFLRSNVYIIN